MTSKIKGSRTERELVQLFQNTGNWSAIRVAGSGLTKNPNPDVLAGNGKRYLALECKATKKTSKHIYEEDVIQIITFSNKFGAEPWFAIKFNRKPWLFLKPEQLNKTKSSNSSINLRLAEEIGLISED